MPLAPSVLAVALLLPGALVQEPPPQPAVASEPSAALEREAKIAALVDEGRAAARVRSLVALGPRMGGTASGERAAASRVAAFEALGLATWVEEDGAKLVHEEDPWRVVLHLADGPRVVERAWPYGFSPSVRGRFPLSVEPDGASALLVRTAPRVGGGAGGANGLRVALVDGRNTKPGDWPRINELAEGTDNPFAVVGIPTEDGAAARAALERGERVELELDLTTRVFEGDVRTVFARIPAREGAPPGYVLFSAHGDSDAGGPGANDNASGEAIVLEIATALAAARRGALVELAREVRFAIWGSEIHSSRAHLERALAAGADPLLAVLNFDQSGYGARGDRLYLEPDDEPHHAALLASLVAVLEQHAGRAGFPERFATVKSLGGTDSYVFSRADALRERGVPALTLYASAWGRPAGHPRTPGARGMSDADSGRVDVDHDPYYHSSGDRPELTTDLQPWFLGWNARVGLLGALRWLASLDG